MSELSEEFWEELRLKSEAHRRSLSTFERILFDIDVGRLVVLGHWDIFWARMQGKI